MDNRLVREMIREWLQQRRASPTPLPALEQIRRDVGWSTASDPVHTLPLSTHDEQVVAA